MKQNSLLVLLLAFLYYASGSLSLYLFSGEYSIIIGVFAAEGIALAFALYFGKKVLLGIFLGQFLLAISSDLSFVASLGIAFINTAEAYLGIFLFRKFHLHTNLEKFRDAFGLFLLIVFVLQPFSALLSSSLLLLTSDIASEKFFVSLLSWWFGNLMGQIVFTPFLLLLFTHFKRVNFKEFFLYGILFSSYLVILEMVLNIEDTLLLLSLSLPLGILVSSTKGLLYGAFFSLLVATISAFSVSFGVGAFTANSHTFNVIHYNLFVLAHVSIILTLGILIEEKKRYATNLEETLSAELKKSQEQQLMMFQQNRLAQMGEMISMIAHQWRQPLNNLALINQLIVSKYEKNKLDESTIKYFKEHSKKQINLMSQTIDNFRNFFKKEGTQSNFSLNDVVDEILGITADIYQYKGVEIDFNADNNYMIYGNANTLGQVILNIINNAKDALLETTQSVKKIQISIKEDSTHILLSIKDNAGGVDEAIIDKIFDPYFSTKEEKNGTGLGLYMAKMIAQEQFGATIDVFNDSEGANFVLALPKREK